MAATALDRPDFRTISEFRERHPAVDEVGTGAESFEPVFEPGLSVMPESAGSGDRAGLRRRPLEGPPNRCSAGSGKPFLPRGLKKVGHEWTMIGIAYNLLKLAKAA